MSTSSAQSERNHLLEEPISLFRQQKHVDDSFYTEVHILPPEKRFLWVSLRTAPTKHSQRMQGPSCRMRSLQLSTCAYICSLVTGIQNPSSFAKINYVAVSGVLQAGKQHWEKILYHKPRQSLSQERPVH